MPTEGCRARSQAVAMVMEKWVDARNVQEAESADLAAGASSDTPEELGRSPPERELGCLHVGQTSSRRAS